MSVNPSARAFLLSSNALNSQSQNVANSYTEGRFADHVSWQEISVAGQSTGVETKTRIEAVNPLPLTGTDNSGDLAVNGEGMLIIKKAGENTDLFVKTGAFNLNKDGYLADYDNILQGYTCDDTGTAITDKLVPVSIDKNTVSEAKATTEIDLAFKLNADTIASGESGALFKESNAPGANILRNEGVVINRMTRPTIPSGVPSMEQTVLQYGGFVETDVLVSTDTTSAAIDTTTPAMNIQVIKGQDTKTIELKVNIGVSTNYDAALQTIVDEINTNHSNLLGAKLLKDDNTPPNVSLFIFSKDNGSQITITPTSDLDTAFGTGNFKFAGTNLIPTVDKEVRRFATLEQFYDILRKDEFSVSYIGASRKDLMFLKSADEEMIDVKNQDSASDVLSILGMPQQNQGTLEPLYSYLDPRYNLAGGHNKADYQERVAIFDSKGGKKDLTFAFKKVSATSWAAEIFTTSGIEASSSLYRRDGLLQAGILNFSPEGAYIDSAAIPNVIMSNNYIADPSSDIAPTGTPTSTIEIDGKIFTYSSTQPLTTGQFTSLVDLVYAINNDATCSCTAELAPGSGGYALVLKAKTAGNSIVIGGTQDILNYIGLSSTPPTDNVDIPLFGSDLAVDWATDTTPIAPTSATINIDGKTSKELKRQHNFLTYTTDGSPFGEYQSWFVTEGDLYMKFKNGAPDKKLYSIPVALFQAPQFFKREGGAYAETDQTGKASIRLSGVHAGNVESKALASSGSNPTEELVDIIGMQQFSQMNATSMSISHKNMEEFLRKI